jgi:DNA-binding NarL/FixJ family response regulator
VLVVTTFGRPGYLRRAMAAGASGFVVKDTPPGELLTAIRVIAAGESLLSPGITRRLISEFTKTPEQGTAQPAALPEVTEREREVLTLIGLGLSNDEIAARLIVSMSTVKAHVGRLLAKLGARDRAQLVIAAYRARLVGDR